jgi:hypothetical protein
VLLANTTPTSLTKISNAGKMLWPILTGETAAPTKAKVEAPRRGTAVAPKDTTAVPDTTNLPAPRELLARIAQAAGGPGNLQRHASMRLEEDRAYLNQGVTSKIESRWTAPDRREEKETWQAAGRTIGNLRWWYDGTRGGQETSFGQDAKYAGDELARARLDATPSWFLDPARHVRVVERTRGDEPEYVVEAEGAGTGMTTYRVSARTALVLAREHGARRERFSDFRNVDGWILPFRTDIDDELGKSVVTLAKVSLHE